MQPHKPEWAKDEQYRKGHVETAIVKEKELLETAPFIESNTRALLADLEANYDVTLPPERITVIHRGLPDLAKDVTPFTGSTGSVRLLFSSVG